MQGTMPEAADITGFVTVFATLGGFGLVLVGNISFLSSYSFSILALDMSNLVRYSYDEPNNTALFTSVSAMPRWHRLQRGGGGDNGANSRGVAQHPIHISEVITANRRRPTQLS